MSHKKAFISHMKSLTERKYPFLNKPTKNNTQIKEIKKLEIQSPLPIFLYNITFKNLKKYSTTKKIYNKFIINSIFIMG